MNSRYKMDNHKPKHDDNLTKEIEALSRMFDYLSVSLEEIHSKKAAYAVKAAKSVMMKESLGTNIKTKRKCKIYH